MVLVDSPPGTGYLISSHDMAQGRVVIKVSRDSVLVVAGSNQSSSSCCSFYPSLSQRSLVSRSRCSASDNAYAARMSYYRYHHNRKFLGSRCSLGTHRSTEGRARSMANFATSLVGHTPVPSPTQLSIYQLSPSSAMSRRLPPPLTCDRSQR